MRSSALPISSYHSAILSPKVTGSAWMPWERPIMTVSLWTNAFFLRTARRSLMSSIMISAAFCMRYAREVSRTSDDVSPRWMKRESGPTFSPTAVRNAMTSCFTIFSRASIRFTSKAAFFLIVASARAGSAPVLRSPRTPGSPRGAMHGSGSPVPTGGSFPACYSEISSGSPVSDRSFPDEPGHPLK